MAERQECVTQEQCQLYRAEAGQRVDNLQDTINDFKITIGINNGLLKTITKLGWFILTSILVGFIGVMWTQLQ